MTPNDPVARMIREQTYDGRTLLPPLFDAFRKGDAQVRADAQRLISFIVQRLVRPQGRFTAGQSGNPAGRPRTGANPRDAKLRAKYGITEATALALLAAQDGKCAICARLLQWGRAGPKRMGGMLRDTACIDHCHKTGKVRGLLCLFCNTSIGKLGDDPAVLRRAAAYIEQFDAHNPQFQAIILPERTKP